MKRKKCEVLLSRHTLLKIFPLVSTLIEVVLVAKPSDVPDTSVHVPEAASMVVRGESGTVSTKQTELFNTDFSLFHS